MISYYLLNLAFQLFIFVFSFTDNSNFIETKALQTLSTYIYNQQMMIWVLSGIIITFYSVWIWLRKNIIFLD